MSAAQPGGDIVPSGPEGKPEAQTDDTIPKVVSEVQPDGGDKQRRSCRRHIPEHQGIV